MELMANARKALAKDPAKTRRLTRQAAREFPKGFFAEVWRSLSLLGKIKTAIALGLMGLALLVYIPLMLLQELIR